MDQCHTDGDECPSFFSSGGLGKSQHCGTRIPPASENPAVLLEKHAYPELDYSNYNFEPRFRDALMYDGTTFSPYPPGDRGYSSPTGASSAPAANCGKVAKVSGSCTTFMDYVPGGLSFEEMQSDTWFCYLYDAGANGGNVGSPCYKIEDERRGYTTPGTDDDGDPLTPPTGGSTTNNDGTRCIPCTGFSCTPARMYCYYDPEDGDETGDPDAPYPTVFGIGTDSQKIVFQYDQLATTTPDGVLGLNIVYSPDSIDTPSWDATTYSGEFITLSHNPWIEEDESFSDFEIYEGDILESGTKQGLRVKIRIEPIIDQAQPDGVVIFLGTRIKILEVMGTGTNYVVGDTFPLSYTHRHPDGTSSTLNFSIKVTVIGDVATVGGSPGFDLITEGDTVNGHIVTRVFHTDPDNFPYHIAYVDGNGSNFAVDGQYTSDRNHQITVKAGYGIITRACLIGYYEFLNKSIQYTIQDIDADSPDVHNEVKQPQISVKMDENGTLTSVTIDDPGQNWIPEFRMYEKPVLDITTPEAENDIDLAIADGVNIIGRVDPNGTYFGDITYGPDDPNAVLSFIFPSANINDGVVDILTNELYQLSADGWERVASLDQEENLTTLKAEVEGTFDANGQLVSVQLINGGRGYHPNYPPAIYVKNFLRSEEVVAFEGVDTTQDGITTFNEEVRGAGTFPEYYEAYDTNPDIIEMEGIRIESQKPKSIDVVQPNTEIKLDPDRRLIVDLPQRLFRESEVEEFREIINQYGGYETEIDKDVNVDSNYRAKHKEGTGSVDKAFNNSLDQIIQAYVPDQTNQPYPMVETVQRRFSNLPEASRLTKYYIKQYRPDSKDKINLKITLGCEVLEEGCGHVPCTGITQTADSSSTDSEGNTETFTYTLSDVLGPGCRNWEINGDLLIRHNFTRSANTYGSAVEAYGNPFDFYPGA